MRVRMCRDHSQNVIIVCSMFRLSSRAISRWATKAPKIEPDGPMFFFVFVADSLVVLISYWRWPESTRPQHQTNQMNRGEKGTKVLRSLIWFYVYFGYIRAAQMTMVAHPIPDPQSEATVATHTLRIHNFYRNKWEVLDYVCNEFLSASRGRCFYYCFFFFLFSVMFVFLSLNLLVSGSEIRRIFTGYFRVKMWRTITVSKWKRRKASERGGEERSMPRTNSFPFDARQLVQRAASLSLIFFTVATWQANASHQTARH